MPASTDNDNGFIGVEYAFADVGAVGLQYFDNGDLNGDADGDLGQQFTLYGNYRFNDIIVKGYIANNDAELHRRPGRRPGHRVRHRC